MALINEKDILSIIKIALDDGLKLGVSYISADTEVEVEYFFIKAQEIVNPPKNKTDKIKTVENPLINGILTPSDNTLKTPPHLEKSYVRDVVKCISYTSNKEDPLKIYGTTKLFVDFLDYVDRNLAYGSVYSNTPYNRKHVMLYPGDWYGCFETDPIGRIENIKKKLPDIIERAKKINPYAIYTPPSFYTDVSSSKESLKTNQDVYPLSGTSAAIGTSVTIKTDQREKDKIIMNTLLNFFD